MIHHASETQQIDKQHIQLNGSAKATNSQIQVPADHPSVNTEQYQLPVM
jgi:hypothetical protein